MALKKIAIDQEPIANLRIT